MKASGFIIFPLISRRLSMAVSKIYPVVTVHAVKGCLENIHDKVFKLKEDSVMYV